MSDFSADMSTEMMVTNTQGKTAYANICAKYKLEKKGKKSSAKTHGEHDSTRHRYCFIFKILIC